VAAVLLGGVRTLLAAAKDDYLGEGLPLAAARSVLRGFPEQVALTVIPLLLLALAASWLARRSGLRRLLFLPLLLVAILGYLHASFRLPEAAWYVPGTEGMNAWAGQAVAGLAGIAAGVALWPRRSSRGLRKGAIVAMVLFLVSGGASLALDRIGSSGDDRPNVILISLDTVRADHLGCYGYDAPTSPELDRFAERALIFDHAFTPEPWTLTAHLTMLTGLTPSVHAVNHERSLSREARTLAELLAEEGLATLAVVDRVEWFDPRFGMTRGFDYYQQMPDRAEMKVDRILDLLDDIGDERFFLFAHFYDAHSDWRRRPYEAEGRDIEEILGNSGGEFSGCDESGLCASQRLLAMRDSGGELSPEELEYTMLLYDAGLRSLDRQIGRLLRTLERRGRFEDTVILITADHGEEFFEHGRFLHSQSFDECVAIPMILYAPSGVRGRSDELVGLVDVTASLLELAGAPPVLTQGTSFAPLSRGEEIGRSREYILLENRRAELGIRSRDWSLLSVERNPAKALFDLRDDPGQERNLLEGEPPVSLLREADEILDRESKAIEILRRRFGSGGEGVQLSAEELESLAALGYADMGN
jgi:hypothetical protein